jgi:hypothetical protein
MKSLKLSLIVAFSMSVVACGTQDDPGGSSQANSAPATYGYEFAGTTADGTACSTGERRFPSRHLMCINIQNPELNSDCALTERRQKFDQDCAPTGYVFREGLQCSVTLLNGQATITDLGRFDPADAIKSFDYCAGYTSNGNAWGGWEINGHIHDGIWMQLDMKFFPAIEGENRSYFKVQLQRVGADQERTPVTPQVEFHRSRSTGTVGNTWGLTTDGAYIFHVSCGMTWGCGS